MATEAGSDVFRVLFWFKRSARKQRILSSRIFFCERNVDSSSFLEMMAIRTSFNRATACACCPTSLTVLNVAVLSVGSLTTSKTVKVSARINRGIAVSGHGKLVTSTGFSTLSSASTNLFALISEVRNLHVSQPYLSIIDKAHATLSSSSIGPLNLSCF